MPSRLRVALAICLVASCGGAATDPSQPSTTSAAATSVKVEDSITPETTKALAVTGTTEAPDAVVETTQAPTAPDAVVETTQASTVAESTTMQPESGDKEVIEEVPAFDIHAPFACIRAVLGEQTAFELNGRAPTSVESALIQDCPEPTHNVSCVHGALGVKPTDDLLAGRRSPSPEEAELTVHCRLGFESQTGGPEGPGTVVQSASTTSNAPGTFDLQSAFECVMGTLGPDMAWGLGSRLLSAQMLVEVGDCPMPTHDQRCIFEFVGRPMLDNLVTGRYQPSDRDLGNVVHCEIAGGTTWSSWLGQPESDDVTGVGRGDMTSQPVGGDYDYGSTSPDVDDAQTSTTSMDISSSFMCVSRALGEETAFELWHRPPTAQEADSITPCPPTTHEYSCVEDVLGMDRNDSFVHGRSTPTQAEIDQVEHCRLGNYFGSDNESEGFGTSDPPNGDGQGDGLPSMDFGEVAPVSPLTLIVGSLQSVRSPEPAYVVSDSKDCSIFENDECAELRWERVTGLRTGAVSAMAISPSNPDVVYAGFDSNDMSIWRSDDAGGSWVHVAQSAHVSGIAVKPNDSNIVIHSVIEGDLLYSSEAGVRHDVALSKRGTDNQRFSAVAYAPGNPDIAYTSAAGQRGDEDSGRQVSAEFFVSSDAGRNWSLVSICDGCGAFHSIVVDPDDERKLWVAGTTGVRISDDGGETWTANLLAGVPGSFGLGELDALSLVLAPGTSDRLLVATSGAGVYRSDDGGQSWAQSTDGLGTNETHWVTYAPSDASVAYVTTHNGVYRSGNGGLTWERRSGGLEYEFVKAIAIDPRNADVAYVGTASELNTLHSRHMQEGLHQGEGLYKTVDGGRNWYLSDTDIEESALIVMSPHPKLPFELWVGASAGRGGFVTTDAGESWLFSATTASHYSMVFAYSHSFPTVQYLSSLMGGVELIRSTDNGMNWSSLSSALEQGVSQRSRESGLLDTSMEWHVHTHGVAVAPSDPNVVYAGTISHSESREALNFFGAHIFRSTDGGDTFQEVDNGFPTDTHTSINAIIIHPTDPNTVYVMTSSHESDKGIGVYKTTDGGDSWFAVNRGLDLETNDLQIDPINPEILYAATATGVYKTTDGGDSWTAKSDGLLDGVVGFPRREQREVFDLAIDPVNPLVLYAAGYLGVYRTTNGGDDWYLVNLDLPVMQQGENGAFDHDRILEIDSTGRVVYAIVDVVVDDGIAGRPLYQAVLGPLRSMGYTYQVFSEVVEIESTSNISGLVLDTIDDELRFVAAGPRGTVGTTSLNVPSSLLEGPFSLLVDGQNTEGSSVGQTVAFTHDHQGQSQIIIRALPVG